MQVETTGDSVLVLGGTGMLGMMVADVLSHHCPNLTVTARPSKARLSTPSVRWVDFDASAGPEAIAALIQSTRPAWVVNCIGVTKPHIKDDDPAQVQNALVINALFPHRLGKAADERGTRVIQIATDCVYSGTKGKYSEGAIHDALDVYGKTKSLGECHYQKVHHLRCSIIGPEAGTTLSLLEWFRGQAKNATLRGFTNHRWNGVTTLQFAKVCWGIIGNRRPPPSLQHLVPADAVTKLKLLQLLGESFNRRDLRIEAAAATEAVDRTLSTEHAESCIDLWHMAGYTTPPTVGEMVKELAAYQMTMRPQ